MVEKLAQRIRELRAGCGKSVEEVAKVCGVEPQYIRQLESGQVPSPQGPLLAVLGWAMGAHPEELVDIYFHELAARRRASAGG